MYVCTVCMYVCVCMWVLCTVCMCVRVLGSNAHVFLRILFMLPIRCSPLLYFDPEVSCRRWDLASSQSLRTNTGMTSSLFWDVTRRSLVDIYRHFASTYLSGLTLEGKAR